jgi:thiamine pyrophosphokinase
VKNDPNQGSIASESATILRSDTPVTLLGGGPILPGDLANTLARAPTLVAADGGAVHALDAGHMPDAVIGDLDSFDPAAFPDFPAERIHHVAEQTSTDFDKALRHIAAPLTLALGFTGARVDHELAAYHTLFCHPARRCILIGHSDIVAHLPKELSLELAPDTRVSLFPLGPVSGRSSGLEWPIDGLEFDPGRRIGTSNRAAMGPVTLEMDGPGMLLILPRAGLEALSDALLAAAERQ